MKYEIVKEIKPRPEIEKIPVDDMTGTDNFIFYINSCREIYFLTQAPNQVWGFVFAGSRLNALGDTQLHVEGLGYQANSKIESIRKVLCNNLRVFATDSFGEACKIYIEGA